MPRSSTLEPRTDFSERLKATPTKPGVYIMRGNSGQILYVGKASKLRNRLRSYFVKKANHTPKIREMVTRVADFEYIVAESEQEALLLECNLIKENKPPYNARLKDDKSYPFIKVDLTEDFPQVYITRTVKKDGSRYFGPFASASSVRRTLALLKKLFPYRSCTKTITGTDPRPCLDFYINRCIGPCIGAVDKDQYRDVIDQVFLFLDGKADQILKSLEARMLAASEQLEFEKAAALRDQVQAIEKVHEGQKVLHLSSETLDLIALSTDVGEAWVEVFFIRQGKLVGRDHFIMTSTEDDTPGQVLTAFVKQFYEANPYVPPRVLVQHELEDIEAIQKWLGDKRHSKVQIYVPQRGEKRRLIEMVAENAAEGLEQRRVKTTAEEGALGQAMEELQEALNLPGLPKRMECYDISNIQGTNSVGSMVVFEDGKAKSSDYRKFKIKTVEGIDDYSMMREMLTRRFRRLADPKAQVNNNGSEEDDESKDSSSSNEAWQQAPDLVLIDGGKGHLGAALQVFLELGITSIPLASLAKQNEELYVPQTPEPIILPRTSPALFLVQRLRDEAHRFAITYHRQRRSKGSTSSVLDQVPGIGPKRRRMLIRQFGSVQGVRQATLEEIAAVPGMTLTLASKVKEWL
jgi:excinuclease ABC subunit C